MGHGDMYITSQDISVIRLLLCKMTDLWLCCSFREKINNKQINMFFCTYLENFAKKMMMSSG